MRKEVIKEMIGKYFEEVSGIYFERNKIYYSMGGFIDALTVTNMITSQENTILLGQLANWYDSDDEFKGEF